MSLGSSKRIDETSYRQLSRNIRLFLRVLLLGVVYRVFVRLGMFQNSLMLLFVDPANERMHHVVEGTARRQGAIVEYIRFAVGINLWRDACQQQASFILYRIQMARRGWERSGQGRRSGQGNFPRKFGVPGRARSR